ncbi:germination protein GerKC [Pullulanibacillus camelliae]|uniref:Germination protein GerKC n=2 Tax=Pullulanibacillus camelliae TaxID=1707096 RepID=A0A8J2W0Y1_9BACL|nr:germination protein GerKC [Pullulanibacillus camelliae]
MREIEHMYYANTIGLDYKDHHYIVYTQIVNFATIAKQEEVGGGDVNTESWVGQGQGDTLIDAVNNLYKRSQRRIYWGHLNTIVLSPAILQHGIDDLIDFLTRYREFRYTLWMFATNNSIKEVLTTPAIFEKSPVYSQLGEPTDMYNQSSYIKPIQLHEFISTKNEPAKTLYLPILSVASHSWRDQSKKYPALEVNGSYFFTKYYDIRLMNRDQLKGLRWLTEQTNRTNIDIYKHQKPVASLVMRKPNHSIRYFIKNGKPYFNITIKTRGTVEELNQSISREKLKKTVQEYIRMDVYHTYALSLKEKVDSYNLLYDIYKDNPKKWRSVTRKSPFPLSNASLKRVRVNVILDNAGKKRLEEGGD